jgi:hypothetical protein
MTMCASRSESWFPRVEEDLDGASADFLAAEIERFER